VEEVSDDLKVRKIMFPSFANLQKPLRSTLDGTFLALDKGEKYTFVERILRLLLVHPVDWKVTSKKISNSALDSLDHNSTTAVEMLSFGPSSNFLLSEIRKRQQNPRMQIVDLSSSTFSPNPLLSDTNDAIAIVGMAVNYPKGKGADALWETLSKGLSAVEEVRTLSLS